MNKLLHANFCRLRKDKTFWIASVLMLLLGFIFCINKYMDVVRYDEHVKFDSLFFNSIAMIGVVIAAFSSMFIGTEYSDGVIRNKVVIGHKRSDIYLANFLTCTLAGLLMNLCYLFIVSVIGIPLFGFFETPFSMVGLLFLDGMLLIVVYSAIFNLIAMLISNKAHITIVSMLAIFAAMIAAMIVLGMLQAPEFINQVNIVLDGQPMADTVPNPRFLTGIKREIYQTIVDILPTGQGLQIAGMTAINPGWMAVYSVIIAILTNVIGVLSFSRKDLK
jgi:ABC-2 type transport system permease protein